MHAESLYASSRPSLNILELNRFSNKTLVGGVKAFLRSSGIISATRKEFDWILGNQSAPEAAPFKRAGYGFVFFGDSEGDQIVPVLRFENNKLRESKVGPDVKWRAFGRAVVLGETK